MATYMSQSQDTRYAQQEHSANSPPDQTLFQLNSNAPQRSTPSQMPNGIRTQNRLSGEYRGGALLNGSKAIPTGPQAHGINGQRSFGGGGAFEGPRSPPNAKSNVQRIFAQSARKAKRPGSRHFARTLQVLQSWSMSGWEGLPLPPHHRYLQVRNSLQVLCQSMPQLNPEQSAENGANNFPSTSSTDDHVRATASSGRNAPFYISCQTGE